MSRQKMLSCWAIAAGWLLAACVPNNVPLGPNEPISEIKPKNVIEIEAAREEVFRLEAEQRQFLPLSQRVVVEPGQEIGVGEKGRAVLHFGNLFTAEMLQGVQVQVGQFRLEGEMAEINLSQSGGTLIVDLTGGPDIERRLTILTPFATIHAANSRFAIIHEANNLLEWVVALAAGEDDLQITASGVTHPLIGGQARWIAPASEPGPVVSANQNVEVWLNGARNNSPQLALGEVLLSPANILADTGAIHQLPPLGEPFEISRNEQGVVRFSLDPQGIFGSPGYNLEDCNGDGTQDVAIRNGILTLDFQEVLGRVQGLDVTVFNRDEPGNGSLQAFDLAGNQVGQQPLAIGAGASQTLSLRSNQRYHAAKLTLANGCFLGFSLTPPGQAGEPGTARPVTETLPADVVVNVLAASPERSPQNGQLQAAAVDGTNLIQIDGSQDDWETLLRQNRLAWTSFSAITYDDGCARRAPNAGNTMDLAGRVQLAYNSQYLYVAFIVSDDGLVSYTGADDRYFLGDSPQLMLDLDLNGDFNDASLSADDIQIDLLPNIAAPKAVLWQLSNLTSRPLIGAIVAVAPTNTGYFLEAALPWQELNTVPQPGNRLGIAASINDNDTPETNVQECIISTSPQRDWRNPTTWGTVLLRPVEQ
jgi:hypothetical protein